MASIVNAIANGITGLVHEAVELTDVILTNKNKKGGEDNGSSEFVPFHGDGMKGEVYDPIAKYINEHFSDMTHEQAQQIYNTIKNGTEKAKVLMEKCESRDLQFRVLRLDSKRQVTSSGSDVMIDTGSAKFEKAKSIFKSATDIVYLGCVMLVKNLSADNGNSLEISSCSIIPNDADMTNPDNYDGEDNTVNIYNKDVYTRFIPSTSTLFYTKSVGEIISQYTMNDEWAEKKDQIFAKVADAMNITVEELKKSGPYIRCVSGVSQLKEQGIDSFDSFRQNAGGFDISEKYVGPNVTLLNKYFKFKTSSDKTDYQITLFELFLTGKSSSLNASADLTTEKKFTISNLNESKIHEIIDNVIEPRPDGTAKYNELLIEQKLKKYGAVVVKDGKYIRPYDEKVQKGEEVIEQNGEVFDL